MPGLLPFLTDVGSAARSIRRRPAFSGAVVLILAASITATASAFSVATGTFDASRWWAEEDRAVVVWPGYEFSRGQLDWLRAQVTGFQALGGVLRQPAVLQLGDRSESTRSATVSPELFAALRARPALGRGLLPSDAEPGSEPVVVLGHGLWAGAFGRDPGVIGRTIEVNGERRQVVGVMPAGAEQPGPGTELWIPLVMNRADPDFWPARELEIAGILRPGVAVASGQEDVRAGLQALARRFTFFFKPDYGLDATVVPSTARAWGEVATPLLLLVGGTWLLLLVAAIDVGHLAVGRSLERRVELRVRAAVGATRRRVVRQLGAEAALQAVAAGILGWTGAALLAPWISRVFPAGTHVVAAPPTDALMFGFVAAVTVLAWALMAGIPAIHFLASTRTAVTPRRGLAGGGPRWLVVTQAALATVLLVTAALLFRTVSGLESIPLGFQPEDVTAVSVAPSTADRSFTAANALRDAVAEDVVASAGALEAGWISAVPLLDAMTTSPVNVEGAPTEVATAPVATRFVADAGGLRALGIRTLAGRSFQAGDDRSAPPVALVNRAMAEALWPGLDPVGRRIAVDPHDFEAWITVVGVVEDARHTDLTAAVRPAYFLPRAQAPAASMSLIARAPRGPAAVTETVRRALASSAPDTPAGDGRALTAVVRDARGPAQVLTTLLSVLAALATILGAVGLYGSLAAWVSRRRTEIGTRLALGASPGMVSMAVFRSGLGLTAAGVLLGLVGGALAGRAIRGLLFGVSPLDPVAFAVPAGVLLLTGAVAALTPALRAAAVAPAQALRNGG